MIHVGITGNIGSGKTLVCSIFEALGIPVYYSDRAGKRLSQHPEIIKEISTLFGKAILQQDGQINRQALADIVFNNTEALAQLNKIIHPRVHKDYKAWRNQQQYAPYTLMESAILFEHGFYTQMDYNICVSAPKAIRIQRVMTRDGISQSTVEARMGNQWTEDKKNAFADFIIHNDGNTMLIPQILALHNKLK